MRGTIKPSKLGSSQDTKPDIHKARDGFEAELKDRLEGDPETIQAWWNSRALSCETWSSDQTDAKRVEFFLTVGGPTVWVEYDGRWGEHGSAHYHHSWGHDYRNAAGAMVIKVIECTKAELNAELVAQLLDSVGVLGC